jgi:hypothetical protein
MRLLERAFCRCEVLGSHVNNDGKISRKFFFCNLLQPACFLLIFVCTGKVILNISPEKERHHIGT